MNNQKWQITIDTGGTFTDVIARSHDQADPIVFKILSDGSLSGVAKACSGRKVFFEANWFCKNDIYKGFSFLPFQSKEAYEIISVDFQSGSIELDRAIDLPTPFNFKMTAYEEAPILAARMICSAKLNEPLDDINLNLGTTKATNAILERKGAAVTLFISKGFRDLLYIEGQQRPDLFQLNIPEPISYCHKIYEVDEFMDSKGLGHRLPISIDKSSIHGDQAICISLKNAFRNGKHENVVKSLINETSSQKHIYLSHEISSNIGFLNRTLTTVIQAYIAPVIHSYMNNIRSKINGKIKLMTSYGAALHADKVLAKDTLLSGPAGGIIGAFNVGKLLGEYNLITFDVGGTSTDVGLIEDELPRKSILAIGNKQYQLETIEIETVAAGGGSICSIDQNTPKVGPESAGSSPGPACYGKGGPLTITDVNFLLNKIAPEHLNLPFSAEEAKEQLQKLAKQLNTSPAKLLRGYENIANEKIANAIKKITIQKGKDPSTFTMISYGGAGGLHACKVAEGLGIKKIIFPYYGGILSAIGIDSAKGFTIYTEQLLLPLDKNKSTLDKRVKKAIELSKNKLLNLTGEVKHIDFTTKIGIRLIGQSSIIELIYRGADKLENDFSDKYYSIYKYRPRSYALELGYIKVLAQESTQPIEKNLIPVDQQFEQKPTSSHATPQYDWSNLKPGAIVNGPAIIANNFGTVFLEPSWKLVIHDQGNAMAEFQGVNQESVIQDPQVQLELFTNRLRYIADEMGLMLQRTSQSVNIRERLDFSCAILDNTASLIVNAPHIPVHLGSLGICTRLVLDKVNINEGDIIITNHPAYGGSHLPDLTLIKGVFYKKKLLAYVVNRAHHAEIGGKTPGSMPVDANYLYEEGVIIAPSYLFKSNEARYDKLEEKLRFAKYPSRTIMQNIQDVQAAVASLEKGAVSLVEMADKYGTNTLNIYMAKIKNNAKSCLVAAIKKYIGKNYTVVERLDDGHEIKLSLNFGDKIHFDFTGSGPVHPNNLNANKSIVYSAVLYFLRLLVKENIPLNDGLLEDVKLTLPTSFLNPNFLKDHDQMPAVVGGNTEVSQRLTDALIKAVELAACSQGTMNNFLFGNDKFGYYETIGGGCGATKTGPGRSAIHQHMTNTRITDPEELEFRFPVRLNQFSIRENSGGNGVHRGGDGIIRELEFEQPMQITILSQHRVERPYGIKGGEPGQCGEQFLIRQNGSQEKLDGICNITVNQGDRIIIKTPGGGAYGKADT